MIYSDPSSPGADGDSHRLFLSIHLSIHLFISLSLPSVFIYPFIYVSLAPFSSSPPSSLYLFLFSLRCSLSLSCSRRFPTCETTSSRYSWGSRIACGLVTRLRTHLLLARQLGPSVHQATILLISTRIGSVAKCFQDYQFTMTRGESCGVPPYTENNAKRRAVYRAWMIRIIQDYEYFRLMLVFNHQCD